MASLVLRALLFIVCGGCGGDGVGDTLVSDGNGGVDSTIIVSEGDAVFYDDNGVESAIMVV